MIEAAKRKTQAWRENVERASKDYDEYADETITRGETCSMNRPSGKKITEIGLTRARIAKHFRWRLLVRSVIVKERSVACMRVEHTSAVRSARICNRGKRNASSIYTQYSTSILSPSLPPGLSITIGGTVSRPQLHPRTWCPRARDPR